MQIQYQRDMNHNYLVIIGEADIVTTDYQTRMLMDNNIEGILRFHTRQVDNKLEYYYEISSKQPLSRILERRTITADEIRIILWRIHAIISETEKYLLDYNRIILDPDYIYLDPEQFNIYLCINIKAENEFSTSLKALLQFILNKVDHEEQESVVLAYNLYQESTKDNSKMEDIMQILGKRMLEQEHDYADKRTVSELPNSLEHKDSKSLSNYTLQNDRDKEYEEIEIVKERLNNSHSRISYRTNVLSNVIPFIVLLISIIGLYKYIESNIYNEVLEDNYQIIACVCIIVGFINIVSLKKFVFDKKSQLITNVNCENSADNLNNTDKFLPDKNNKNQVKRSDYNSKQKRKNDSILFRKNISKFSRDSESENQSKTLDNPNITNQNKALGKDNVTNQSKTLYKPNTTNQNKALGKDNITNPSRISDNINITNKENIINRNNTLGKNSIAKMNNILSRDIISCKNNSLDKGNIINKDNIPRKINIWSNKNLNMHKKRKIMLDVNSAKDAVCVEPEDTYLDFDLELDGTLSNQSIDLEKYKFTENSKTMLLYEERPAIENVRKLVKQNQNNGNTIEIKKFPFILGKLAEFTDYQLDDNCISRLHAKIDEAEGIYYITDLNSTNGTFVNQERLAANEQREINIGDEIKIANIKYIFS